MLNTPIPVVGRGDVLGVDLMTSHQDVITRGLVWSRNRKSSCKAGIHQNSVKTGIFFSHVGEGSNHSQIF